MSMLRRAVFPILIGLLAFAIGIAVGGGPLQTDEGADDMAALERAKASLQDEVDSLRADAAFDEGVNQSLSGRMLAGQLAGRSITLIVLPGVPSTTVEATEQALKQADGQVAVVARLAEDFIDPGKKTYVDSVVTSSMKGVQDLADLADSGTYVRAGALLSRAYAGRGSDANIDDEAAKIDAELQGAKLVALEDTPIRRGTFVVVLAPGAHGSNSFTTAQMVIANDMVSALVRGGDAVVVASTPTSSQPGGLIDVLSADEALAGKRLSTVNVIDSAAGRTTMVYALAAAASGAPGNYGVEGGGSGGSREVVLPPGLAEKSE